MEVNKKFNVGLIGAGFICEYHIQALKRIDCVNLVGVFDADPIKAKSVAIKHQVKVFDSIEDFQQANVNVVHILTPPSTHTEITLRCLKLGFHTLVEKPLTVDPNDCDKISELAHSKQLQVCVNHSLLYDPLVIRAQQLINRGAIGNIVSVDIIRSSNYPPFSGKTPPQYQTIGYPFRDLGVHALYLMQYFLGEIKDIKADFMSLGGDPNLGYDEWRAQVRCEKGLGQFQLSWNVKPLQSQIIIQGTHGVLYLDLFLMTHRLRKNTPLPKTIERVLHGIGDGITPLIQVPVNIGKYLLGKAKPFHGLQNLVAAFYQQLAAGKQMPASVPEAKSVITWVEKVSREAEQCYQAALNKLPPLNNAKVLVTGAGGNLGGAIVKRLLAESIPTRILVRRLPSPVPSGVEIVIGDLGDPDIVEAAVAGVETVIHAGATMKGAWEDFERGTIQGTRNIANACLNQKIKKLIYISSLSVVDWASADLAGPITENAPYEPRPTERGYYTQSKLEAEMIVREHSVQGLPVIILRPGQIFGGKIPLLTPAVARKLGSRYLVLGSGDIILPLVHLDDVIEGIMGCLTCKDISGQVIQLVDIVSYTQSDILKQLNNEKTSILYLPRALTLLLGGASEVVFKLLGRQSPISRYRLKSAMSRTRFQSNYAETILKWRPVMGIDQGIRESR